VIGTATAIDRATDGRAFSTLGVTLACLALIAFGVAAALAAEDGAPSLLKGERALGPGTPVVEDPKRVARRALLAVAAIGGFLVAIVAPSLGIDYVATWPATPRESATFVAVVAGLTGVVSVASLVGARLRATRTEPTVGRRIALAMAIGLGLGIVLFLSIR
jgi:hypothetical protein